MQLLTPIVITHQVRGPIIWHDEFEFLVYHLLGISAKFVMESYTLNQL